MWRLARGMRAGALAGATACAGTSMSGNTPVFRAPMTYEWVANLPNQELRGLFAIFADTIVLTAQDHACRPAGGTPSRDWLVYECLNVGAFRTVKVQLARRNPLQGSLWSGVATEVKQRRICAPPAGGTSAAAGCRRATMQQYEEDVQHSGRLTVQSYRKR